MIQIVTGQAGSGKNLVLTQMMIQILKRNYKWYWKQIKMWKKNGKKGDKPIVRKVYTNTPLSEKYRIKYKHFLDEWLNLQQLVKIKDADVFFDEIAESLNALDFKETPPEVRSWLFQHRKLGIEIYGISQDFGMIDKNFRRMTSKLLYLKKWFGNRDPSATSPPVKFIWGVINVMKINPIDYDEDKKKQAAKGFKPLFITKRRVQAFDTRYHIKVENDIPLQHFERKCITDGCDVVKLYHR